MKNIKFIIALIITAILFSYTGCSDDDNSVIIPPVTNNSKPSIPVKSGYTYEYTNDSLIMNGSDTLAIPTTIITTDVVLPMLNIGGQDAYPIYSRSQGVNTLSEDSLYVRYDSTAGKFHQYGINNFIDSTQPRTWDLIADFSIARNQSWQVGIVNYTVVVPIFGPLTFTGPLTAKVADSLSFKSTGSPEKDIYAYRIELFADLSSNTLGATAKIYIDYYLGFRHTSIPGNPTGIVRLKLRPFSVNIGGSPVYAVAGFDRKIRSWSTP